MNVLTLCFSLFLFINTSNTGQKYDYNWVLRDWFDGNELELINVNSEFIVNTDEIEEENDSISGTYKMIVYPNPVKDKLYFNSNSKIKFKYWEIFNMKGQKVLSGFFDQNSLNTIDGIDKIYSGLYFIRLTDTNKTNIFTSKFFKL